MLPRYYCQINTSRLSRYLTRIYLAASSLCKRLLDIYFLCFTLFFLFYIYQSVRSFGYLVDLWFFGNKGEQRGFALTRPFHFPLPWLLWFTWLYDLIFNLLLLVWFTYYSFFRRWRSLYKNELSSSKGNWPFKSCPFLLKLCPAKAFWHDIPFFFRLAAEPSKLPVLLRWGLRSLFCLSPFYSLLIIWFNSLPCGRAE